jgi:hypothetical protein
MAKSKSSPLTNMPPRGSDPFSDATAITPSDSADLLYPSRAIYVGGAGDITVVMFDEPSGATPTVTFKAVPVGITLLVCARRVMATATTATNLVALN